MGVEALKRDARHAMRRGVLGLVSLILLAVGLAFLTHALWIVLAALKGTLFAAQVIGALYCGFGLIGLAVAMRVWTKSDPAPPRSAIEPEQMAQLAQAFVVGLEAGRSARRR